MLPYGRQTIEADDIEAVVAALQSDWLTTGPRVRDFESAFASVAGTCCAAAVSNGTAALHAIYHALGIGPGDEVIVPAITFVATANAVVYCGGAPVFADVSPHTLLVDPEDVRRKITPRTRAIVAVDFAGQPCDYDSLREVADEFGLVLVADACHSLGAQYRGRPVGSLADMTAFSLHPVKPITAGEGGVVTTDREEWAEQICRFRNHGIDADHRARAASATHQYDMAALGFNLRLTDLQSALAHSQLKKLARFSARRQELADRYDRLLENVPGISPLARELHSTHAYHLYVVRVDAEEAGADRDTLFGRLRNAGFGVNVHYRPVYQHSWYRVAGYGAKATCPIADQVYPELMTLPLFPAMEDADVERVIAGLEAARKPGGLAAPAA